MNPSVSGHPWSAETLFCKAQLYIQRMEAHTADDWQFGFWSALALEMLARASLATISPVLLAEKNDWHNLTYALGHQQTSTKFIPRSVPVRDVLSRLQELVPAFNDEISGFCKQHIERRNRELHSGELAFENLGTSDWLARFYSACKILLQSMKVELEVLVSEPEEALRMIEELKDAAASSVKGDIEAHNTVWSNKGTEQQETASSRAATWATRHAGHRVECPACGSQALLQGTPSGPVATSVTGDQVVQRQTMWPSSFECIACGLRISGLSKLAASGLGNAYSATRTYTAAEFFELYTEDELEEARNEWREYEPDFNE